MKVTWDFKELYDFADKLQNTAKLDVNMKTATQKIAKVLHQYLLELTPVDTGNLKKLWNAGNNLAFTVEPVAGGFQVTLINEANVRQIPGREDEPSFYYGTAVNDGHRHPSGGWVMGRFFVEKSFIRLTEFSDIENIVYKQLQKWWDSI